MNDDRKSTLVSLMRPTKTDREAIYDLASAIDSFRESQERHNGAVLSALRAHGSELEQVKNIVLETGRQMAELTGHVMRADAAVRDGSSHDLEQDAKLAALHQRVETVETGWQKTGRLVVEFFESPKTRTVGRIVFGAAVTYLIGKDTGLLHAIGVALQGSGVMP